MNLLVSTPFYLLLLVILPTTEEQQKQRKLIVQKIARELAQDTAPKDISREFMPYIMHMLGKISLCNSAQNIDAQHIEVIQNLFAEALENKRSGCAKLRVFERNEEVWLWQ